MKSYGDPYATLCPINPAYHKDFNDFNLSKEIKSIRQPRQSFLCTLIDRNQAGEDINDMISFHIEF